MLDVLARYKPPVVSFHFGLPKPEWVAAIQGWGGHVWSSATTVDEGLWLQEQGCDVVVAQGLEAGGHRGHFLRVDLQNQMGLRSLLPQLVAALKVPVLAAGGVANAAGVQAAKRLGAAGVQVGTAYLYCPEASPHPLHKAALLSARAGHTQLTNLFTGRAARGIVNGLMQALGGHTVGAEALSPVAPAFPLATHALVPLRAAAEAQGHDDFIPLWAGQSAALCQPMSAADLTLQLGQAWQELK
jgi:nitronate monooxygenase